MTNLPLRVLMLHLILTAAVFSASGQNLIADSTAQTALYNITEKFQTATGPQLRIYNGPVYRFHPNSIKGTAYFNELRDWRDGTATYEGLTYYNVKLMYDVVADAAVVLFHDGYSTFSLQPDKLQGFTMLRDQFINFTTANTPAPVTPGIYHVLYDGGVQVLAKQSKAIQTSPSSIEQYFRLSKSFFIRKNNAYYKVTGESDIWKALKDKKKELKQILNKSNLKYRQNPEEVMTLIATEYDRLTTQQ